MFFSLPMCKMKTRWDLPKKKKKHKLKQNTLGAKIVRKKKKNA